MSRDDVLRRPLHHLTAKIEDELLVLDPASRSFHVLSPTAASIYEAVDGQTTAADIAERLGDALDVATGEVLADVEAAVDAMTEGGLLIADDPSSGAAGLPRLPIVPEPPIRQYGDLGTATDAITSGPVRCGAATLHVWCGIHEIADLLVDPLALLPAAAPSDGDSVVSVTEPGDGGPFEIHLDQITIASAPTVDGAADSVLTACNQVAATKPTDAVRIHGGVVSKDGRALVICGESGSGKSTLTAALVQRGWSYLTDEVAIIDPTTFEVTPYPKWVDLSPRSLELLGLDARTGIGPRGAKHHIPPNLLGKVGPTGDTDAARVDAIVMLTADAPDAPMGSVQGREAVEAMLGNVFATTWDGPNGLQALVDLCQHAEVVQMPRRNLTEMVDAITALVDR